MSEDSYRPVVAVILVAAGRGTRAMRSASDLPKQYRKIGQRPVLGHTLDRFISHSGVHRVLTVIHGDDLAAWHDAAASVADPEGKLLAPVIGGASRQQSVANGLRALQVHRPDLVLIHDAVRPFVSGRTISSLIETLADKPAVLAGVPVTDTVWRVDTSRHIQEQVPRDGLWRAATPQGFHFNRILAAHERAAHDGLAHVFTDDAAVSEWAGDAVFMVEGNMDNIKLTLPGDFDDAERKLMADDFARLADIRVGTGYDVHAFDDGACVTLCGIEIPHSKRLMGHSDADVALHAVTDAILGALGDGDIGAHFPPGDSKWRGAASHIFVEDAVRRVRERGGMVAHIDISLIAELPKIGPHREAMRARVAEMAGIGIDRVGVKATTNEKLGFVGRCEGIAAIATVTVRLPM